MAVPLAATFSLLLATFFRQNDRAILDAINAALPYRSVRLTANIRDFIDSARAVSGVGLVALIATSLRLIFVIESAVNFVWGAPRRKKAVARMAVYTIGLFAGALLLGVFLSSIEHLETSTVLRDVLASALFGRLAATLVVAVALALLYKYLPNARVSWRSAAASALAISLALRVLKLGFAFYFSIFTAINFIYGSLSLVLIVLIALFLFWLFVLGGVEMTCVLEARRRPLGAASAPGGGALEGAVRLLLACATGPAGLDALSRSAGLPAPEAERLAAQLARGGLLAGSRAGGFRPARPLGEISLADVARVVSADVLAVDPATRDRVGRILRRYVRKFSAEQQILFSITLDRIAARR